MEIFAVLATTAILVFFWINANEFASYVMFLVMAAMFGLLGLMISNANGAQGHVARNWLAIGCGVVIAWFVSGLPVYIKARRNRQAAAQATGVSIARGTARHS